MRARACWPIGFSGRLLGRGFPSWLLLKLWVRAGSHGVGAQKQVSPLCRSTGGERALGSEGETGARNGARSPGGWAARSGREVTGDSPPGIYLTEDAYRLNKDSIRQLLDALGFLYWLFKYQLSGHLNTFIFLHFCALPTSGPFSCPTLNVGCVELIGIFVVKNETLTQLLSSQIAISTFPMLTFKIKCLPRWPTLDNSGN